MCGTGGCWEARSRRKGALIGSSYRRGGFSLLWNLIGNTECHLRPKQVDRIGKVLRPTVGGGSAALAAANHTGCIC
eukprot:scaffold104956_cov28-Tisochrysis_lutea.AAC.4